MPIDVLSGLLKHFLVYIVACCWFATTWLPSRWPADELLKFNFALLSCCQLGHCLHIGGATEFSKLLVWYQLVVEDFMHRLSNRLAHSWCNPVPVHKSSRPIILHYEWHLSYDAGTCHWGPDWGEGISCSTHPVILDELLHVVLGQIVGLDVGLHKLFVGDGPQVSQALQLHEELLEVELHQRTPLVAAFLHIRVAEGGGGGGV